MMREVRNENQGKTGITNGVFTDDGLMDCS